MEVLPQSLPGQTHSICLPPEALLSTSNLTDYRTTKAIAEMGKGREERRVKSESVSYSMLNFYCHGHQFLPTFVALKSMMEETNMGKGREERGVKSESISYSTLNFYSHCPQFLPTFMALKSMREETKRKK